jgi:hypothetical protein
MKTPLQGGVFYWGKGKEQGAWSKEQGARSKEQGARGMGCGQFSGDFKDIKVFKVFKVPGDLMQKYKVSSLGTWNLKLETL